MRVTCPSCHAEVSLEVLLESDAARRAVARLAEISLPFGALVLRYVALFRPAKRRLSIERMVTLLEELLPDLQRQVITRKGREWQAPHETWRAAMEAVLAARDKGTLTLPLTTHGYLYEVLVGLADKYEATNEREREKLARARAHVAGPATAPAAAALALHAPAPVPAAYAAGPSRAARAIKAQMAAALERRKSLDGTPPGADEDDSQD